MNIFPFNGCSLRGWRYVVFITSYVIVAHNSIQRVLARRIAILFYFCMYGMVRHISIQRVLAPRMAICILDSREMYWVTHPWRTLGLHRWNDAAVYFRKHRVCDADANVSMARPRITSLLISTPHDIAKLFAQSYPSRSVGCR